MKRLALVGIALVLATALGGCVSIKSRGALQQGGIGGPVRVTVTVCATDTDASAHPGCQYDSNSGQDASTVSGQVLIGLRVPAGTNAPGTANSSAGEALTFRRSATYEAELSRTLTPPAGYSWVGYISDLYSYNGGANGTNAKETTLTVDLGLPTPAENGPFPGPFRVAPIAGGRTATASTSGRPVKCGATATTIADGTMCMDSPPNPVDLNPPTLDAGVVAGNATASPGQTLALPFDVRVAGPLATTSVPVTATTNLPGTSAVPLTPSATVGTNSSTRVPVNVEIPKSAGPGTFDVRLSAKFANGLVRTGTAKLTVRDRQPPVVSKASLKPKKFKPRKKSKGLKVSLTLSEAASLKVTVERCTRKRRGKCRRYGALKRGTFTKQLAQGAASFRYKGYIRGKRLPAGSYRLSMVATDAAGNPAKATRLTFSIKR